MLAIRLARVGAKKQAAYRVVVMEKSRARDSRSVEIVGHYNPRNTPTLIELKQDRVDYWLGQGAQPSDRVSRLLKVYKERPAEAADEKPAGKGGASKAQAAAPETAPAEADAAAGSAVAEAPAEAKPAQATASGEEPKPTA
jgi:small subunit ribosomal protein S16